jgi:signal transduction histidine kinase
LKELAARLITAGEDERSRIARELHDDITQRMAALAIQVGQWKRGTDLDKLKDALDLLQSELARLSNEIHQLSRRLHSSTLEDLGLAEAIESECRRFFDRGGPPVDIQLEGDFTAVPSEIALTLYRIVQESLRNIEKHAGASEARVTMRRVQDTVELEIRDNGMGFSTSTPKVGLGLSNMRERARLLNGTVTVESSRGNGTSVLVKVPWRDDHGKTTPPLS